MELLPPRLWRRVAVVGLLLTLLAGLLLAASELVPLPPSLVAACSAVVFAGLLATAVGSWVSARRTGASFGAALKHAVRNCWDFVRMIA